MACSHNKAGCISWREGRGHPERWLRPRGRRIREYGAAPSSLPSSQADRTLSPSRCAGTEMQPAVCLPEPPRKSGSGSGILEEDQRGAGRDFEFVGSRSVSLVEQSAVVLVVRIRSTRRVRGRQHCECVRKVRLCLDSGHMEYDHAVNGVVAVLLVADRKSSPPISKRQVVIYSAGEMMA